MTKRRRVRELLAADGLVIAPGVYDGLSARLAQQAGFPLAYITGYGTEAAVLGAPDIGLISMSEVVTHARNVAAAVDIPLLCDADTGYGGPLNVHRTVRAFEQAGLAGIHLEDQTLPKKCGGLPGRSVVGREEMLARIRAAVQAREDRDFLILARSDARSACGLEEAIVRFNLALDAGADMAMVAERYTPDELATVAREVRGPVCICGGIPGWEETLLSEAAYRELGIKLVLFPLVSLYAAARAIADVFRLLHAQRRLSPANAEAHLTGFDAFNALMGLDAWQRLDARAAGRGE